ncbi:MAG: NAD-dependent epimerase/dehydratase family protein, partial [Solirubrobacteraceae bacterium]
HGDLIRVEIGDVRDKYAVRRAMDRCQRVFHLAAQVAVTTSLDDPVDDLAVNVQGTVNVLEEARRQPAAPAVVFTSTNKVYGRLGGVELRMGRSRYEPASDTLRARGISERQMLEFCSPYGCSKGAADQYVLDWARSFRVPSVVFRMSCIYGPHQQGNEDQGWVAHFVLSVLEGQPITLFGDGKQVRDVLYAEDLVRALVIAEDRAGDFAGRAFNIGGGPGNAVSLLDVIAILGEVHGERPTIRHEPWRPGDQRYYVSDTSAFGAATGWQPETDVAEGVERLYAWLVDDRQSARAAA